MRVIVIIISVLLLKSNVSAQGENSIACLTLNASKKGILFSNIHYFKKFGILIQDTCSSFNRFDGNFYSSNNGLANSQRFYNAVIVDSGCAISIETQLKKTIMQQSDKSKSLFNISKKLRNFIRLYSGFLNENGDTCIVIQYITSREYKNGANYYTKQMDLIAAKNRKLRFVVFEKFFSKWYIKSFFPNDFLK